MPIPSPNAGETQDEFIGRCHTALAGEHPDQEQRNAICFNAWKEQHSKATAPTHRVSQHDGRVTIHDVELFVGYDARIDAKDHPIARYDANRVRSIVDRTKKLMAKGQVPKVIVGHNERDKSNDKPAFGDVPAIRFGMIDGAPGIYGDIDMAADDFESLVRSNRFPRRSIELWRDDCMSEVALLGATTPGRPLPDMKFDAAHCDAAHGGTVEMFSRYFQQEPFTSPGPATNPRGTTMADEDKSKMEHGENCDCEKCKENKMLHAKIESLQGELEKYRKERMSRVELEGKNKDLFARVSELESQNEQFAKAMEDATLQLSNERIGRKLDDLEKSGFRLVDRPAIQARIVSAKDPDAEVEHYKKILSKVPIGPSEFVPHLVRAGPDDERRTKAAIAARDRCVSEGKTGDPVVFDRYFQEELKTA